jgi:hypothetical protein
MGQSNGPLNNNNNNNNNLGYLNIIYDNYDEFEHVNFVLSQNFIPLF